MFLFSVCISLSLSYILCDDCPCGTPFCSFSLSVFYHFFPFWLCKACSPLGCRASNLLPPEYGSDQGFDSLGVMHCHTTSDLLCFPPLPGAQDKFLCPLRLRGEGSPRVGLNFLRLVSFFAFARFQILTVFPPPRPVSLSLLFPLFPRNRNQPPLFPSLTFSSSEESKARMTLLSLIYREFLFQSSFCFSSTSAQFAVSPPPLFREV